MSLVFIFLAPDLCSVIHSHAKVRCGPFFVFLCCFADSAARVLAEDLDSSVDFHCHRSQFLPLSRLVSSARQVRFYRDLSQTRFMCSSVAFPQRAQYSGFDSCYPWVSPVYLFFLSCLSPGLGCSSGAVSIWAARERW
jgi:hypothetical protein